MAYIYLQQDKIEEALILYALLHELFKNDTLIAMSFSFCLFKTQRFEESNKILDLIENSQFDNKMQNIFYVIRSKVLWKLGKLQESRIVLKKYLVNRK